jgi:hypothetical protein
VGDDDLDLEIKNGGERKSELGELTGVPGDAYGTAALRRI